MKRKLGFLFGLIVMMSGFIFVSCKGDDKDSLSGVYAHDSYQGYGSCYEFINHNTLVFYPSTHLGKLSASDGMLGFTEKIGNTEWYNCDDGRTSTYTYVYEDNKVVIPMAGRIFTKSGNTLILEDSGDRYVKQ